MPLVYACVAPHGGEVVPALAGDKLGQFLPTRRGMRILASEMKRAKPDAIVIATPHNLRLHRHIGVVTSEYSSGVVKEGKREIKLKARCDMEFAQKLVEAGEAAGLPVVGATYGVYEGPLSDLSMDWGALIPLWFFLRGTGLKSKVVIVTPSRGIPLALNFEFGRVLGKASEGDEKRVAFVASADQAHAHSKRGPYGYSPSAAKYDGFVVDAIRAGRLESVMDIEPRLVEGAKPDSLWQMAMLAGAIAEVPMKGELRSYQVPTYYGMLCAGYSRKP